MKSLHSDTLLFTLTYILYADIPDMWCQGLPCKPGIGGGGGHDRDSDLWIQHAGMTICQKDVKPQICALKVKPALTEGTHKKTAGTSGSHQQMYTLLCLIRLPYGIGKLSLKGSASPMSLPPPDATPNS